MDYEMKEKSITSLINNEYLSYSKYVAHNRAIPSLIDGFKPVQRKAFYVVPKSSDFIKVQSVSGRLISDANYSHGDSSASQAISLMGQDFIGSNNIPVFSKKGSFGSKFIKEPSAPRYIYVKANKTYYNLFKDLELCPKNEDIENPEPKYYLPIIPTILLNGVTGIAVGFSTSINPYNINDIIKNIKLKLDNKSYIKMVPYFKGYIGPIKEEDSKFVQYGVYKQLNTTTIKISEIPTSLDREKYKKHLSSLVDKKIIASYEINNIGDKWDITIKFPRVSKLLNEPEKWLKLTNTLSENITVIDENGNLVVFNNVYELLDHFIDFRLGIYQQRIDYKLKKIEEEIVLCNDKIKFITEMCGIDFKNVTKNDIRNNFEGKMTNENLEKCFDIKSYNLNIDFINELNNKIDELKKEFEYYKNITPKELYLIDLNEIEKGC
jgi:DNA gyrase/topoisomerase IV subunit A